MEATRNRKDYSKTELYLGNFAIAFWILLGAAACALFVPLSALGFIALSAFLIFYELGKHGCVTCYYCKTCTIGMGKLPELFFRKAGTANVNRRALRLFPFVYILMSVVPIALVAFSLTQAFVPYKVALLIGLATYSLLTGIVRRKNLLSIV